MAQHILVNAFSLSMLPLEAMNFVRVRRINPEEVPADVESAVGHADTARVVSGIRLVRCTVHWAEAAGGCNHLAGRRKPRVPRGHLLQGRLPWVPRL